jgi:GH24 family phage-related lysozyme (muramidase)
MNKQHEKHFMGRDGFYWFFGKVVDREGDTLSLGRVRVRVFGIHPDDENLVPNDHLPWATPIMPVTSAGIFGVGASATGLMEGSYVFGFFADGEDAQIPMILGSISNTLGHNVLNALDNIKEAVEDAATAIQNAGAELAAGTVIEIAVKFLVKFEGLTKIAKDIGDGKITIGIGHVINSVDIKRGYVLAGNDKILVSGDGAGTPISRTQASALLQTDLPKSYVPFAVNGVGNDAWAKLNANQKAALISYAYNCGPGGMRRLASQGLRAAILAGDNAGAANIIRTKGITLAGKNPEKFRKGLQNRRNAEAALYEKGVL